MIRNIYTYELQTNIIFIEGYATYRINKYNHYNEMVQTKNNLYFQI